MAPRLGIAVRSWSRFLHWSLPLARAGRRRATLWVSWLFRCFCLLVVDAHLSVFLVFCMLDTFYYSHVVSSGRVVKLFSDIACVCLDLLASDLWELGSIGTSK